MPFAWGRKRSFEPLRHHGVERLYPLIEFQLYREIKARDVSDQSLQRSIFDCFGLLSISIPLLDTWQLPFDDPRPENNR